MIPRRIVVVGAGISGLAAAIRARDLAAEAGVSLDLSLLEAGPHAGGTIGTDEVQGFRIERGADGFLLDKPHLRPLLERLGVLHRLVSTLPASQGALVVRRGRLLPIPAGFTMMAPTRFRSVLSSPLLSLRGKARLGLELLLPRGPERPDESLASFVTRRFGREVLDRLAQPLVGGIYGAAPDLLSLRATMPRFLDEERASRSVTLGLRRKAKLARGSAQGARYSLFGSFDAGMQVLVDALVHGLPAGCLRSSIAARAVRTIEGGGYGVETDSGVERADAVILAVSARVAAGLLEELDPALSGGLGAIPHGSAITVTFGYTRRVLPPSLDVYGFVVPEIERRAAQAATFLSRKWPGRAPGGHDLLRVFLRPGPAGELLQRDDGALAALAASELASLTGVRDEPAVTVVRRYVGAMPQYHVGHLDRRAAIEERERAHPGLALAGNSLAGVGIPDALQSGQRAAERVLSMLGRSPGLTA